MAKKNYTWKLDEDLVSKIQKLARNIAQMYLWHNVNANIKKETLFSSLLNMAKKLKMKCIIS